MKSIEGTPRQVNDIKPGPSKKSVTDYEGHGHFQQNSLWFVIIKDADIFKVQSSMVDFPCTFHLEP
jgi:hypothetical protein